MVDSRTAIGSRRPLQEDERLRTLALRHLLLESAFGRPALGDRRFERYGVVFPDGVGCDRVRQLAPAKKPARVLILLWRLPSAAPRAGVA